MRERRSIHEERIGAGSRTRPGSEPRGSARTAGRPTSEDKPFERTSASDLFLRGTRLEEVERVEQALVLYERALAIPEAKRTPLDTVTILHHVGNCSSKVGDVGRAWDAYLASARLYRDSSQPDYLRASIGASLGEAGLLLADYRPGASISEIVCDDLIWEGLKDLVRQADNVLLADAPPTRATAGPVHRQLTGMMMLAAHASAGVRLSHAGKALDQGAVTKLFERYRLGRNTESDVLLFIAVTFRALARLCDAVGAQERPERKGVPPSFDEVDLLARAAGAASIGSPRPMMRWLGTYLRDHRGASWATDEILEAPANRGAEWVTSDHVTSAACE